MEWWDFLSDIVGRREFPNDQCAKCHTSFCDYEKTGTPYCIPYGTMISNVAPVLCSPCYAKFLIMVSEWLPNPK